MRMRPSVVFGILGAVGILIFQGCAALKPAIKTNLLIKGQEISTVFRGVRDGPSSYSVNSKSYSPKPGYRFYTVFVTLSNEQSNSTLVDLENFILFDQNGKTYTPGLVYLSEFQMMEGPYYHKMLEKKQSLPAAMTFVLTLNSTAKTLLLPNRTEIELPKAKREEE